MSYQIDVVQPGDIETSDEGAVHITIDADLGTAKRVFQTLIQQTAAALGDPDARGCRHRDGDTYSACLGAWKHTLKPVER